MSENNIVTFDQLIKLDEQIKIEVNKAAAFFTDGFAGYQVVPLINKITDFKMFFLELGKKYYNDPTLTSDMLDEKFRNELASMKNQSQTSTTTYTDSDKQPVSMQKK